MCHRGFIFGSVTTREHLQKPFLTSPQCARHFQAQILLAMSPAGRQEPLLASLWLEAVPGPVSSFVFFGVVMEEKYSVVTWWGETILLKAKEICILNLLCKQALFLLQSKPLCFHLERGDKITDTLGKQIPSSCSCPEPDRTAEILLISCKNLNQMNFMDFRDAGCANPVLSPLLVETHGISPAKPAALSSSGFIPVQLRA